MSWKPEVFVEGKWSQNSLVFETMEEAEESAKDAMNGWFLVLEARAVESDRPVNSTYIDHKLKIAEPKNENEVN